MTAHKVHLLGNPHLREQCKLVENPRSAGVRVVLGDLKDTLKSLRNRHGFGRAIAAPQIGAPIRVVYIDRDGDDWWLINPEIVDVNSSDFLVWDDCFSFLTLQVRVQRAYNIRFSYLDYNGEEHEEEAEGPLAGLIQHELDHLDGLLAVDRPTGVDPFCFRSEWEEHHSEEGRFSEPFDRTEPTLPRLL